ncbi:MAG: hypothetical protein WB626_02935 [Bacteroidota bacterium]
MRRDARDRGFSLFLTLAMLLPVLHHPALSSPRPASPPGVNGLVRASGEYRFLFNGETLYRYSSGNARVFDGSGGVLGSVRARTFDGDSSFIPAFGGGPVVDFAGEELAPSDSPRRPVFLRRRGDRILGDTLVTEWSMRMGGLRFNYRYRMHIEGRTLIIRAEAAPGSDASAEAAGFTLGRSEHAAHPRALPIPSLPLLHLMAGNNSFTSLFFDWEKTSASALKPDPQAGPVRGNPRSVRYAPGAVYGKGSYPMRNPLSETIYLTVAPDLEGALPHLRGPAAPFRQRAVERNVLAYDPTYTLSLPNACGDALPHPLRFNYWDSLYGRGVKNLAVIIKTWQRKGFDRGYPAVLPANPFDRGRSRRCVLCENLETPDPGGSDTLRSVLRHIGSLGYAFALHENYVDFHEDAGNGPWCYTPADRALDIEGIPLEGVSNADCGPVRGFVLAPRRTGEYAAYWSRRIGEEIYASPLDTLPVWGHLDVHSSLNPSVRVDWGPGSRTGGGRRPGLFRETLSAYRSIAETLRRAYGGPVQGEGGHHVLYAGFFDDFEARIRTADPAVCNHRAPLLVDFDILKLRPKSALHGVGHWYNFFAPAPEAQAAAPMDRTRMLEYVATELAYGHGGLTTMHWYEGDISIEQAVLEEEQVLPVYRAAAGSEASAILYGPEGKTASRYILDHPGWWDIASRDFMAQVRVEYANGVVVCVNRHPSRAWQVTAGLPGGWFARHADGELASGRRESNRFSLPPQSGWVAYIPLQ